MKNNNKKKAIIACSIVAILIVGLVFGYFIRKIIKSTKEDEIEIPQKEFTTDYEEIIEMKNHCIKNTARADGKEKSHHKSARQDIRKKVGA